jgi:hypothetical protein
MQIDLRFGNKDQGNLAVVVAPVLRFADIGFNADIRIEEIGPPDRIIAGFAPELFGTPLDVGNPVIHSTRSEKEEVTILHLWLFLLGICCGIQATASADGHTHMSM